MSDARKVLYILLGVVLGVLLMMALNTYIEGEDLDAEEHHAIEDTHTHTHTHDGTDTDMSHSHDETVAVNATTPPTLEVVAHSDGDDSVNLELITTNFTFAPERVNQEHVDGEGHAHVYVDGVKVARIYGNWFHLDTLEMGTREVTVGLYANDHKSYVIGEEPVAVTFEVVIH